MNFNKNNRSEPDLKPWQSREGSSTTQTMKRCWDGLYGCEEYKKFEEYKYHPQICGKCAVAICNRYDFEPKYADYLILLLWQESNLSKSSKFLGANHDKLNAIQRTTEQRLRGLWDKIKASGGDATSVQRTNMAYRDWFYRELGISIGKGANADGFSSVASAVLV